MSARWRRAEPSPGRPSRPPASDIVLAAVLFAAFEVPGLNAFHIAQASFWAVAGAVTTVPLAWRRRRPVTVWLITAAGGAFLLALWADPIGAGLSPLPRGLSLLVFFPGPLVALYTAATCTRRVPSLLLAGSLAAPVATFALIIPRLAGIWGAVGEVAYYGYRGTFERYWLAAGLPLVIAWSLGGVARARRESAAVRADRDAAVKAETAERDRAAVADERARIARELHDITAHHVSVVALQAGTARLMAESGHPPGAEMLRAIEDASRLAMSEIRQALGVIRYCPGGAAPAPGLAQVGELAARMRGAGLAVTLTGTAGPLPAGLGLAGYRVVQEGLTNVLRHSLARAATVTLCRGEDHLEIVVSDDGPARAGDPVAGPGGHGLPGLRERVSAFGGCLSAGPRPGGGFELRARLPLPDSVAGGAHRSVAAP